LHERVPRREWDERHGRLHGRAPDGWMSTSAVRRRPECPDSTHPAGPIDDFFAMLRPMPCLGQPTLAHHLDY
jgi:hypothetical protein